MVLPLIYMRSAVMIMETKISDFEFSYIKKFLIYHFLFNGEWCFKTSYFFVLKKKSVEKLVLNAISKWRFS